MSGRPVHPSLPAWRFVAVFAAAFVALHLAWSAARDSAVERFVIDTLTVAPAARLVNLVDPGAGAAADGYRIRSPGQTLSVLNGCEGTEVMLLLAAAFAASGLPWGARLGGLAAGLALAWTLNQARIAALFFAARHDRELFGTLHGVVLPLVIVASVGLFFAWWIARGRGRDDAPAAAG
jgi:exosortase/archaeosortase family protein